jgi:poly(hydroxyalkanoate) depolymerase family esterase
MKLWLSHTLSDATASLQRILSGALPDPSGPSAFHPDIKLPDLKLRGRSRAPTTPAQSQFLQQAYADAHGKHPYKLYIPHGYRGQPVPLIVMLHGCTQSPDDFAAGTRMNEAAEADTCIVAWPQQVSSANPQKCWNWFREVDQQRDRGEPSVIAGITREVMRDYAIDPRRVYIAGLSAGGAAAAIMGETYPDLYAAVGVHSGLPCGAARDLPSALAAMRHGSNGIIARAGSGMPPTIVFHGDGDTTVHPKNGDAVVAQAANGNGWRARQREGSVRDGHAWQRTQYLDDDGMVKIEHWLIHGAGHAWSGGSRDGSFTDPLGPDATAAMMRFFLAHTREHAVA